MVMLLVLGRLPRRPLQLRSVRATAWPVEVIVSGRRLEPAVRRKAEAERETVTLWKGHVDFVRPPV